MALIEQREKVYEALDTLRTSQRNFEEAVINEAVALAEEDREELKSKYGTYKDVIRASYDFREALIEFLKARLDDCTEHLKRITNEQEGEK